MENSLKFDRILFAIEQRIPMGVSKFTTVEVRKSRADSLTPIDPNYDILGTCMSTVGSV